MLPVDVPIIYQGIARLMRLANSSTADKRIGMAVPIRKRSPGVSILTDLASPATTLIAYVCMAHALPVVGHLQRLTMSVLSPAVFCAGERGRASVVSLLTVDVR